MSRDRQPAEWAPHARIWSAWPSAPELWEADLEPARAEVAALFRAIALPDPSDPKGATTRGEPVSVLYRGEEAGESAAAALSGLIDLGLVELVEAPIGDIWLRDTGPIFTDGESGRTAARFRFNWWGKKYHLPEDDRLAQLVAERAGVRVRAFERLVAEGGAIDVDGAGTAITTRQCLLNPNRNPGMTEAQVEAILAEALGIEKTIWLDEGLAGDHTDGHVDNIARFVAPGVVVCQHPTGFEDPNREVLREIAKTLRGETDAGGRALEVVEIPSPGLVEIEGEAVPASHMNFVIANEAVVMPRYESGLRGVEAAVEATAMVKAASGRRFARHAPSDALLSGGGSFHCITQQEPA